MATFNRPNFDGLVAPAHNLSGAYVGHRSGKLTPLQNNIFRHFAIGVDIDALVVITKQELHPIGIW